MVLHILVPKTSFIHMFCKKQLSSPQFWAPPSPGLTLDFPDVPHFPTKQTKNRRKFTKFLILLIRPTDAEIQEAICSSLSAHLESWRRACLVFFKISCANGIIVIDVSIYLGPHLPFRRTNGKLSMYCNGSWRIVGRWIGRLKAFFF